MFSKIFSGTLLPKPRYRTIQCIIRKYFREKSAKLVKCIVSEVTSFYEPIFCMVGFGEAGSDFVYVIAILCLDHHKRANFEILANFSKTHEEINSFRLIFLKPPCYNWFIKVNILNIQGC